MPPVNPSLSPDLVASLPHWLQVTLVILGLVVPIASLVASILNQYVRAATDRGERVSTWLLALTSGVNVAALNPDKSVQAVKAITPKPADPIPAPVPVPAADPVKPVDPPAAS